MRMIKVTSCADCPERDDMKIGYEPSNWAGENSIYCDCERGIGLPKYPDIADHIANETIHPDCPLEVCDE